MGAMQGFGVVASCYWEVRGEFLDFVFKPGGQPMKVYCYLERLNLLDFILLCAIAKTNQAREGPG